MTRSASVVLASAVLLTVAACGGRGHEDTRPDVHACKAAMVQRFHDALSTASPQAPTPTDTRPPECAGVSDQDMLKIVAEIFSTDSPEP